jgi:hypothetical protein
MGARLSPCGQVVTITQPLATHRRRREVLTAGGRVPTKSLEAHAPLRRPRSIGFEPGGVLREFDHRFTFVAPLRLACRARAIRWCPRGPALSGLLPSSPTAPGSDCPQLHQAAATARRRGLTPPPDPTAPRGAQPPPPSTAPPTSARLPEHIGVLVGQQAANDLIDRHPVALGHRGARPFVEPSEVRRS